MPTIQRSERGQVLVFLALTIVALFGFSALAIDGGMLYSDRRHAQNAADTSSLAGASAAAFYMREHGVNYNSFICGTSGTYYTQVAAENAAIARAQSNDYVLDTDASDHHGVTTQCGIDDKGSYLSKYIDVITDITQVTKTNFAHLVYKGPLQSEVEAVARVYPPGPLAFGHAIIALNEDACSGNQNGVIFSGSSTTTVTGGGVWSNGCLVGNGSSFTVTVNDGGVGYAGTTTGTITNIHPSPQYIPSPIPSHATYVDEPDCSGLPSRNAPNGGNATLEPGIYDRIKWTNGSLTLNPGLYCVTGSQGVSIQGGEILGDGVTIFLANGGMTVNGNVSPVDLRAPEESPDPAPAIPGILIFLADGNTSTISLTGNSTSFYLGAIYAPDGDIYASGSSGTHPTFNTQLIGNNVEVSGGAIIDINFNDDENYEKPPYLDLQK
ncbi:MAG: Tad domain-containing protein [Anaerolineales bacterium]